MSRGYCTSKGWKSVSLVFSSDIARVYATPFSSFGSSRIDGNSFDRACQGPAPFELKNFNNLRQTGRVNITRNLVGRASYFTASLGWACTACARSDGSIPPIVGCLMRLIIRRAFSSTEPLRVRGRSASSPVTSTMAFSLAFSLGGRIDSYLVELLLMLLDLNLVFFGMSLLVLT